MSLGCPKNLVDSEEVAGLLSQKGAVPVSDPYEADVLIVNTCAFIRDAVEETISTIIDLEEIAAQGNDVRIAVIGCFVQRFGKKLLNLFPDVDIFIGTGFFHKFDTALETNLRSSKRIFWINRPSALSRDSVPRLLSGSPHTAYVKISEGCSHSCSFCLIPKLRGPQRSRPMEMILNEVRELVRGGTREVVLVGQDTTAYGTDLGSPGLIVELLKKLTGIPGLRWLRLMYAYPGGITDELLSLINENPVILPYLDIPVQHVVPGILRGMGRDYGEFPEDLVERVRSAIPRVVLRTSLIVGFPGETTRDFKKLLRFVEWAKFDRLGVFGFSREKGSRAYRMKPRVRKTTINKRKDEILTLQAEISYEKHRELIGTIHEAIVEHLPSGNEPGKGRLWSQAPEVDGDFFFTGNGLKVGDIATFKVTSVQPYDLEGVLEPKKQM